MQRKDTAGPKDGATRTREWLERKKIREGMNPVQYLLTDGEKVKMDAYLEILRKI